MNKRKVGGENAKWLIVINGQNFGLWTSSLIFQQIKNLEMWFQLPSTSRNYFSCAMSEFCSKCYSHMSRWCLCLLCIHTDLMLNRCIFSKTNLRNKNNCFHWYQNGSLLSPCSGYMQVKYDDASSTLVQTILANHAHVFSLIVCSLILSSFITTFIHL